MLLSKLRLSNIFYLISTGILSHDYQQKLADNLSPEQRSSLIPCLVHSSTLNSVKFLNYLKIDWQEGCVDSFSDDWLIQIVRKLAYRSDLRVLEYLYQILPPDQRPCLTATPKGEWDRDKQSPELIDWYFTKPDLIQALLEAEILPLKWTKRAFWFYPTLCYKSILESPDSKLQLETIYHTFGILPTLDQLGFNFPSECLTFLLHFPHLYDSNELYRRVYVDEDL